MSGVQIKPRYEDGVYFEAPQIDKNTQPKVVPPEENPSFVAQNKMVLIIIAIVIVVISIISYFFFVKRGGGGGGVGGGGVRGGEEERMTDIEEGKGRAKNIPLPPQDLNKIAEQAAIAKQRRRQSMTDSREQQKEVTSSKETEGVRGVRGVRGKEGVEGVKGSNNYEETNSKEIQKRGNGKVEELDEEVEEPENNEIEQFIIVTPEEPEEKVKCSFKLRNNHFCKNDAIKNTERCAKHAEQ